VEKSIKSSRPNTLSTDSYKLHLTSICTVDTSLTLIQSAFTHYNIYKQANDLALANSDSHIHLLLQVLDRIKNKQWSEAKVLWAKSLSLYAKLVKDSQINLFGRLSEQFFEQFVQDSLDQNLIVVKKFKTINGEKPKNISMGAFRFDKYTSVETEKTKYLYICLDKATSTRQIDQWLSLILAINITGINIIEEERYLENKDLPEKIIFPPNDIYIKQRYRLTDISFCNGSHHIADVHFENIKNSGWYQYDRMGKTYRARAMYIGNVCPLYRDSFAIDFVIYAKI
ncbi:27739_t:CDS:2, partial [Gigaspora margarita]